MTRARVGAAKSTSSAVCEKTESIQRIAADIQFDVIGRPDVKGFTNLERVAIERFLPCRGVAFVSLDDVPLVGAR